MTQLDLNSPGFHQTDGEVTRVADGLTFAYRAEYQIRPSHSGDFDMRVHAIVRQGKQHWHIRQTRVFQGHRARDAACLLVLAMTDCIGALPGGIGVVRFGA